MSWATSLSSPLLINVCKLAQISRDCSSWLVSRAVHQPRIFYRIVMVTLINFFIFFSSALCVHGTNHLSHVFAGHNQNQITAHYCPKVVLYLCFLASILLRCDLSELHLNNDELLELPLIFIYLCCVNIIIWPRCN